MLGIAAGAEEAFDYAKYNCTENADGTISGQCGDNLFFIYYPATKVLKIYGTGSMWSFAGADEQPWAEFSSGLVRVNIEHGITSIDKNAFTGCASLEIVSFAGTRSEWDRLGAVLSPDVQLEVLPDVYGYDYSPDSHTGGDQLRYETES